MHTPDGGVEVTQRRSTTGELLVVRGVEALSDGAPVKITRSHDARRRSRHRRADARRRRRLGRRSERARRAGAPAGEPPATGAAP